MKIDAMLNKMREAGKIRDIKGKGTAGEEIILGICLDIKRLTGGVLIHSFKYPYTSRRSGKPHTGNIKYDWATDKYYSDDGTHLHDEIDVLLITPYRLFPIEVKAEHCNMHIYDHWMDRDNDGVMANWLNEHPEFKEKWTSSKMHPVDKSRIAQTEKHARMLYHQLHTVLPDGRPEYIQPLTVFVDRCSIDDTRSIANQMYLPVTILNEFKKTILSLNQPLRYQLDLDKIREKLRSIKISSEKEFDL